MVTEITRRSLEALPTLTLMKVIRMADDEVGRRLAAAAQQIINNRTQVAVAAA